MEIDMDKYTIKSDTQNLWIEKKYMTSDGKVYTKRVAGYCRNLEQLYASFLDARVRDSEAKTVREILRELKEIRAEILELSRKGMES